MKFPVIYCLLFVFTLHQLFVLGQTQTIQVQPGNNSADISATQDNSMIITLNLNRIDITDTTINDINYIYLQAEGLTSHTTIGAPNIPIYRTLLSLPNSEIPIFTIESYTIKEINLDASKNQLLPVQKHLSKQQEISSTFEKNDTIYLSDSYYSAFNKDAKDFSNIIQIDYIGQQGNNYVGRINIAPILYNPVKNKLFIYTNIKIKIYYSSQSKKNLQPSAYKQDPYPITLGENSVPICYAIVSPPQFKSAITSLVQWKKKKGFHVIEIYTDDVAVGNTSSSIQTYLKSLYTNATIDNPAPKYILLIGDIAQLPTFNGIKGTHVTDYYYGEYTNDYLPEAEVGRLSGSTATLIAYQIEKIVAYESYNIVDPSYLGKALIVAGNDKTYGVSHMNPQVNYAIANYVNLANGFTVSPYFYPQSATQDAEVMQKFNQGVGFVNYSGHGSENGWNDPTFRSTELAAISNDDKFSVIINNACITNKFNIDECFCESVLRAKNKGAVACIGASNDTYWDEDYYWAIGYKTRVDNPVYSANGLGAYDRLFHTHGESENVWASTIGDIMKAGNLSVVTSGSVDANYYWEVYNLMGDPSLMPYLGVPKAMNVTYPAVLPVSATTLIVKAEKNTYVALSFNDTLYAAAATDATGQVILNFKSLTQPGTATLVCTGQNKIPLITTIDVKWPNEPYVNCTEISINDSLGNSNKIANANEKIYIDLNMTNYGFQDAEKVTIVASTDNSNIKLIDSSLTCNLIKGSSSITLKNALSMQVNNTIKDYSKTIIHLLITDLLGNSWENYKTITAESPLLTLTNFAINDSLATNFNKRLEPSESATLILKIRNAGHADAINTTITIKDSTQQLIFITNILPIDTIKALETISLSIPIEAGALITPGSIISLAINQKTDYYSFDTTCLLPVGFLIEDFEEQPTSFNWNNNDEKSWFISDSACISGNRCMQSGKIKDLESTNLSINYKVLQDDSISFYIRVSSEKPFDKLVFYIDNTVKSEWSDEIGWTKVTYAVTSGNHIFNWVYTKDKNTAFGKDAAWIDKIIFPPVGTYDVAVNNPKKSMIISTTKWIVYPNPVSDGITIKSTLDFTTDYTIRLFDINGKQLIERKSETSIYYLQIPKIPSGIYYIQIIGDSSTEIKKIVKK